MRLPNLHDGLKWKVCVNTYLEYEDGKNVEEFMEFSDNYLEIPPRSVIIFEARPKKEPDLEQR